MKIEKFSWKTELVATIIDTFIQKDKTKNYETIGYYYKCEAPKYLYKYFSDNHISIESIKNNKIWFSAPCNYNDVFDCDLSVDDEKIFDFFLNSIPDNRRVRVGSTMWHDLRKSTNQNVNKLRKQLSEIKSTIGISCFSEVDDSLLMWAHYANNHAGICVEYDINEIVNKLKYTPVPVLYSNDRIIIDSIKLDSLSNDILEAFVYCIVTKSREWSYEKEWRIIRDKAACGDKWNTESKGALLDMIKPHSLILGCMVKEDIERQAKVYCNDNKVNLYKMKKSEDTYSLIKENILVFYED